jgi:hypothetical protein
MAKTVLHSARCIYVLGFGFDRNNCTRIGLEPQEFLGQRSEAAARIYADEEDRRKRASAAIRKLERRVTKNILKTKNV